MTRNFLHYSRDLVDFLGAMLPRSPVLKHPAQTYNFTSVFFGTLSLEKIVMSRKNFTLLRRFATNLVLSRKCDFLIHTLVHRCTKYLYLKYRVCGFLRLNNFWQNSPEIAPFWSNQTSLLWRKITENLTFQYLESVKSKDNVL